MIRDVDEYVAEQPKDGLPSAATAPDGTQPMPAAGQEIVEEEYYEDDPAGPLR